VVSAGVMQVSTCVSSEYSDVLAAVSGGLFGGRCGVSETADELDQFAATARGQEVERVNSARG